MFRKAQVGGRNVYENHNVFLTKKLCLWRRLRFLIVEYHYCLSLLFVSDVLFQEQIKLCHLTFVSFLLSLLRIWNVWLFLRFRRLELIIPVDFFLTFCTFAFSLIFGRMLGIGWQSHSLIFCSCSKILITDMLKKEAFNQTATANIPFYPRLSQTYASSIFTWRGTTSITLASRIVVLPVMIRSLL